MVNVLSAEYTQQAREVVLGRVKAALAKNPIKPVPVPRNYLRDSADQPGSQPVIEVFVEALKDYRAEVKTVATAKDIPQAIKEFVGDLRKIVIPEGLEENWISEIKDRDIQIDHYGEKGFTNHELDQMEAVITASRCAISHTGTIILDGCPDQGRRAISLVPDTHIVVVEGSKVFPTVPQAVELLKEHPQRAVTWIAGPSATSDIELIRVDGVHGPRNLYVIIVTGEKEK